MGSIQGVNHNNAIMQNPYQRAMLFLTYLQGKDVTEWVIAISRWLTEQIDNNGVLPTNEWLWRSVEHSFRRQYADTLAKEWAQAELKKGLKWTGDVDAYVTKFEQLVRAAGYEIDGDLTIDMFTSPLLRALYEKIFQDDHPVTDGPTVPGYKQLGLDAVHGGSFLARGSGGWVPQKQSDS